MSPFTESHVEEAALEWLGGLGYDVLHGPDISPDGPQPERVSYGDVIPFDRLIQELIDLAKDIRAPHQKGEEEGLSQGQSPSTTP